MLREMHNIADTKGASAKEEGTSSPRPANLADFTGRASAPHRTPDLPISFSSPPTQT
jgi:hypothetical protein